MRCAHQHPTLTACRGGIPLQYVASLGGDITAFKSGLGDWESGDLATVQEATAQALLSARAAGADSEVAYAPRGLASVDDASDTSQVRATLVASTERAGGLLAAVEAAENDAKHASTSASDAVSDAAAASAAAKGSAAAASAAAAAADANAHDALLAAQSADSALKAVASVDSRVSAVANHTSRADKAVVRASRAAALAEAASGDATARLSAVEGILAAAPRVEATGASDGTRDAASSTAWVPVVEQAVSESTAATVAIASAAASVADAQAAAEEAERSASIAAKHATAAHGSASEANDSLRSLAASVQPVGAARDLDTRVAVPATQAVLDAAAASHTSRQLADAHREAAVRVVLATPVAATACDASAVTATTSVTATAAASAAEHAEAAAAAARTTLDAQEDAELSRLHALSAHDAAIARAEAAQRRRARDVAAAASAEGANARRVTAAAAAVVDGAEANMVSAAEAARAARDAAEQFHATLTDAQTSLQGSSGAAADAVTSARETLDTARDLRKLAEATGGAVAATRSDVLALKKRLSTRQNETAAIGASVAGTAGAVQQRARAVLPATAVAAPDAELVLAAAVDRALDRCVVHSVSPVTVSHARAHGCFELLLHSLRRRIPADAMPDYALLSAGASPVMKDGCVAAF